MKDESMGKINDEFIGLKSKMHSMKNVDGKENKTGKGIDQNVVKNTNHEEYINVLFNKKVMRHNMKRIQSKLHKIGINDINTLAFFHKDIRHQ